MLQYGIVPYIKEELLKGIKDVPYCFKFDETTNSQIKKQYNGYITFYSQSDKRVVTSYCGSLFLGHCTANDLLDHFYEFMSKLCFDPKNLLNIGMDGPNVSKSFLKKLGKDLQEKHCTCFIDIGSCPLHIVNNSFAKGINSLKSVIDLDRFAIDLHFFFSLSSARREDFQGMSEITDVTVHYLLKHCCTRWLSIDKVGENNRTI